LTSFIEEETFSDHEMSVKMLSETILIVGAVFNRD